jgi:hypothetical protein
MMRIYRIASILRNYLIWQNTRKDSVEALLNKYISLCAIENHEYNHSLATIGEEIASTNIHSWLKKQFAEH